VFIRTYKLIHKLITDADARYSEALAVLVCSLLMRNVRTVGVTGKPDGWRHNLYFLLLGPPGSGRSTAIWEVFRPIIWSIRATPGIGSPESYCEGLAEIFEETDQAITITDEANKFFRNAGNPRHYMSGLLEDLTRIWDCPPYHDRRVGTRKNARVITINQPYLCLLFSGQTIPFSEIINTEMLEQGFFCRLIPVVSERTVSRDLTKLKKDDLEPRKILGQIVETYLKTFSQYPILLDFSDESLATLNTLTKRLRTLGRELNIPQVADRYTDNLVRIAGVYTFDEGVLSRIVNLTPVYTTVSTNTSVTTVTVPNSLYPATTVTPVTDSDTFQPLQGSAIYSQIKLNITNRHLGKAYRFLRARLQEVAHLYANIQRVQSVKKVVRLLELKSPRTSRNLLRNSHLLKKDFTEALETLTASGEVCAYIVQETQGDVMKYHLRNCATCEQDPQYCPDAKK
jgi:hypothetical protein